MREHLYLLDYLLGSGIRLCGVGVTDSHGQRMLADMESPARLAHQETIAALGARDRATLIALLGRLVDAHARSGDGP